MKILVTGATGFLGENVIAELSKRNYNEIYECDSKTTEKELDEYTKKCDFVFHFAGLKRPEDEANFVKVNVEFTSMLLDKLKKNNNKSPILYSSSIQADLNTSYAKSKKMAEKLLFEYEKQTGVKVILYRLANLYGEWTQNKYNGVVVEFCKSIAKNEPIKVSNPEKVMELMYIKDVANEFVNAMEGKGYRRDRYYEVVEQDTIKLGELVGVIEKFKALNGKIQNKDFENEFIRKLYYTYLCYAFKENQ